jgi:uncharacterized protein (TIGR03083 family)
MGREEAAELCAAEYARMVRLLRDLQPEEWQRQTECPRWDVRAMTGHIVGFAEAGSLPSQIRMARAGRRVQREFGLPYLVDGSNEAQIRGQAHRSTAELVEALERAVAGQVLLRRRTRWYMSLVPAPSPLGMVSVRGLNTSVYTRDVWIHRVDICRATGRALELSAEHDGRIVEDVVAAWANKHRRPFRLHLDGPAGGFYVRGTGGDALRLDAVEFCRILSGRAPGTGLLATPVLF